MTALVFIDADSMLFKAALTEKDRAAMKLKYRKHLKEIERNTFSDKALVAVKGLGKGFRYDIYSDYKKNRKPLDEDLKKNLNYLHEYALDLGGIPANEGWEADDTVASWVKDAWNEGLNYVIAHIDKDLDMLPGQHYNYNKVEHYAVSIPDAQRNFFNQLLMGDSADGIPGAPGIGKVKAAKLLDNNSPDYWYRHIRSCYNSRADIEMNARLLFMGDPEEFTYDLQSLYCTLEEREQLLHRDESEDGQGVG